jgi:hypothetical protein
MDAGFVAIDGMTDSVVGQAYRHRLAAFVKVPHSAERSRLSPSLGSSVPITPQFGKALSLVITVVLFR